MSKSRKVRVLEAIRIKEKGGTGKGDVAFKVQTMKGEEPVTMLYNQLKYTYPDALIDFFEAQWPLVQCDEDNEEERIPEDKNIFDYDAYLSHNGCKILEHINSFTLSYHCLPQKDSTQSDFTLERVYGEEADNFYRDQVLKADSIFEEELKVREKASKKAKR